MTEIYRVAKKNITDTLIIFKLQSFKLHKTKPLCYIKVGKQVKFNFLIFYCLHCSYLSTILENTVQPESARNQV